jgi:hypothetical protein
MSTRATKMRGLLITLCGMTASAAAQPDERIAVPLTDATRPAVLEISVFRGAISVSAYDGNEVVIVARETTADEEQVAPRDGLRRIRTPARLDGKRARQHGVRPGDFSAGHRARHLCTARTSGTRPPSTAAT